MTREVRRARADPGRFVAFCFRDAAGRPLRQAAVHRELQAFLSEHRRAVVELPRDHGKTVQVCGRVVWELGHAPGLRVKVVSATDALAADRARFLRDAVADNRRVRLVFPHLLPADPWGAGAFTVRRPGAGVGPSVEAFGVGSAATGARADLIVLDDVVGAAAAHSRTERDRAARAFEDTLVNLLDPAGRLWSLSTPWHADDLAARLKRRPGYAVFRRPVGPDLAPVWPERWPREALEARRAEIGPAAFARGYHLEAAPAGEVAVRPEWVRFCDPLPRVEYERVAVSVDPAVSVRPGADRTAVVVVGRRSGGAAVDCLGAAARRVRAPDLVDWLAGVAEAWAPDVILFEANAAFLGICDLLKRHASFGAKVAGHRASTSKEARVAALAAEVAKGAFRLAGAGGVVAPDQAELFAELTAFPLAEHDDLVDAAAAGVAHLLAAREPRVWA